MLHHQADAVIKVEPCTGDIGVVRLVTGILGEAPCADVEPPVTFAQAAGEAPDVLGPHSTLRSMFDYGLDSWLLKTETVTLDVTEDFAKSLKPGSDKVALRDPEGVMLAVLHVADVWQPDR